MSSVLAILSGAVAVALLMSPSPLAPGWPGDTRATAHVLPGRARLTLVAAAAVAVLAFARGSVLVLALIVVATALAADRLAVSARLRKEASRRETRVLETCTALVGELRAGQPPAAALVACIDAWPELEPVATAARLGADVPQAMRTLSTRPGAAGMRAVADAWEVSHGSGAGLGVALAQVAESAREAQTTRRLVASELASARATARLVAALPVLALLMGSGVGGEPWQFLLGSPLGLACLAGGLALGLIGLFWIDRISAAVLRA